jgi:uncharacterized protein with LGFP repeats
MMSFLEAYRDAEKSKKSAKAAAVAAKQGIAQAVTASPMSAADSPAKATDDLSEDEEDDDDVNNNTVSKDEAMMEGDGPSQDRKRPRLDDDETDSDGADENEERL